MHARALIGLGILVAVLFGLRTYLADKDAEELDELREATAARSLFQGITPEDFDQLSALVIDNVERAEQLRFERDAAGRWYMVDPVSWPAEIGVLKLLFDTVMNDRGVVVDDVTPVNAGLDPPKAVCTFVFAGKGDYQLEVGAKDLGEIKMYVRTQAPGQAPRMMRANRALEAIFDRFAPDYRSKVLVRDEARNVVRIERRGPLTLPAAGDVAIGPAAPEIPNPLVAVQKPFNTLNMQLVDGEASWLVTEPFQAVAEPQAVGMLAATLCNLDAVAFPAEALPNPALFGFDRPELEIDVHFIDGAVRRFRFARTPVVRDATVRNLADLAMSPWVCQIDDRPQVFEVDAGVVLLSAGPVDAFFDRRLARGELVNLDGFELQAAGRTLAFEQTPQGWTVSGRTSTGELLEDRRAEKDVTENVFLRLRQAELQDVVPDWQGAPTLVAEGFRYTYFGREVGGTFAPPMWKGKGAPPEERPGLLFKRNGDSVWATIDPELTELLRPAAEHYLDRRLFDVEELRIGAIRLEREGRELVYERDVDSGRWRRAGESEEARDFAVLVDRLRSIKALAFEFGAEPPAGRTVVTIEVADEPGPRGRPGFTQRYELAVGDERGDWYVADGLAARLYPGLGAGVEALFD